MIRVWKSIPWLLKPQWCQEKVMAWWSLMWGPKSWKAFCSKSKSATISIRCNLKLQLNNCYHNSVQDSVSHITVICWTEWPQNFFHIGYELCLLSCIPGFIYHQISNISHTLVSNKIVDHSEVVGAPPVWCCSNYIFIPDFNTWLQCIWQRQLEDEMRNI